MIVLPVPPFTASLSFLWEIFEVSQVLEKLVSSRSSVGSIPLGRPLIMGLSKPLLWPFSILCVWPLWEKPRIQMDSKHGFILF